MGQPAEQETASENTDAANPMERVQDRPAADMNTAEPVEGTPGPVQTPDELAPEPELPQSAEAADAEEEAEAEENEGSNEGEEGA